MKTVRNYYTALGTKRAIGASMDVWPVSNYMELTPQGSSQRRLRENWENVGRHLYQSIADHGTKRPTR